MYRYRASTICARPGKERPSVMAAFDAEEVMRHVREHKIESARLFRKRSRSNKKISQRARWEIQARTAITLKGAIRPTREGRFFEHFIVVGYPPQVKVDLSRSPDERTQEPVVLFQYPEDGLLNEQVVSFCFPNGVTPTGLPRMPQRERSDSEEDRLHMIHGPLEQLKEADNSFVFLMTGEGVLLYGICVTQNEFLSYIDKPSFFKSPAYCPPSLSSTELKYDLTAPRVYCFLSRFPFFKLHFNVLYTILATERKFNLMSFKRLRQMGILRDDPSGEDGKDDELRATEDLQLETTASPNIPTWKKTWSKGPARTLSSGDPRQAAIDAKPGASLGDEEEETGSEKSNVKRVGQKPTSTQSQTLVRGMWKSSAEMKSGHRRTHSGGGRAFFERMLITQAKREEELEMTGEDPEEEGEEPFPGIPLKKHDGKDDQEDQPFPGIPLRSAGEPPKKGDEDGPDASTSSSSSSSLSSANSAPSSSSAALSAIPRKQVRKKRAKGGTMPEGTVKTDKVQTLIADTDDKKPAGQDNVEDKIVTIEPEDKNRVVALLDAYHRTNVSGSLKSFIQKLPPQTRQEKFVCPEGDEEKLIAEWCLPSLLRLLPLDHIILLLRALMLEFKIVFLCKNLGVLSNMVLSCIPLLRPFVWQGPFIPIVPKNLEECVESPVPYVMGMQTLGEERIDGLREECMIFNIDNESVLVAERELPHLPHEEDLIKHLTPFHTQIHCPARSEELADRRQQGLRRPTKTSSSEQVAVKDFLRVVRGFQERLIQEIINYAHIYCIAASSPAPSLPSKLNITPDYQAARAIAAMSTPPKPKEEDEKEDNLEASVGLGMSPKASWSLSDLPKASSSTPSSPVSSSPPAEPRSLTALLEAVDKLPLSAQGRDEEVFDQMLFSRLLSTTPGRLNTESPKPAGSGSTSTNNSAWSSMTSSATDTPVSLSSPSSAVTNEEKPSSSSSMASSAPTVPKIKLHAASGEQPPSPLRTSDNRTSGAPKFIMSPPSPASSPVWTASPLSSPPTLSSPTESPTTSPTMSPRTSPPPSPKLRLSLAARNAPLASPLPQLAASTFDFSDMKQLNRLVALFPIPHQKFMKEFLFSQQFTVFTDKLTKLLTQGRAPAGNGLDKSAVAKRGSKNLKQALDEASVSSSGASSSSSMNDAGAEDEAAAQEGNVLTPRSAAKFADQLRHMIEQEENQSSMAQSLLQIYTMLEQERHASGSVESPHPLVDQTTKEKENMERICQQSAERLRILNRSRETIRALFMVEKGLIRAPDEGRQRGARSRHQSSGGEEMQKASAQVKKQIEEEGKGKRTEKGKEKESGNGKGNGNDTERDTGREGESSGSKISSSTSPQPSPKRSHHRRQSMPAATLTAAKDTITPSLATSGVVRPRRVSSESRESIGDGLDDGGEEPFPGIRLRSSGSPPVSAKLVPSTSTANRSTQLSPKRGASSSAVTSPRGAKPNSGPLPDASSSKHNKSPAHLSASTPTSPRSQPSSPIKEPMGTSSSPSTPKTSERFSFFRRRSTTASSLKRKDAIDRETATGTIDRDNSKEEWEQDSDDKERKDKDKDKEKEREKDGKKDKDKDIAGRSRGLSASDGRVLKDHVDRGVAGEEGGSGNGNGNGNVGSGSGKKKSTMKSMWDSLVTRKGEGKARNK